ncbi:MAG: hypothetical protein O3C21_07025 [Verrucomicrobia bacterium]|nr:hypothetical protein [Verrucomicrobiota bacterium]
MKKAVWIAIASLAIVGIVTGVCMLASKQYWDSKAAKIEFMLWDRNHENEAHVTDADLIRSVSACGATATEAGREIHISIDTRFVKKKWTIEQQ